MSEGAPSSPRPARTPTLAREDFEATPADVVRPLPRILAIANQKGGVGKTTTAVNLGAGLAELGYRVLVVDLDPQGNATTGLGINARNLRVVGLRRDHERDADRGLHRADRGAEPVRGAGHHRPGRRRDRAGARLQPGAQAATGPRRDQGRVRLHAHRLPAVARACSPSTAWPRPTRSWCPIQCEYYALEGLGQLLRNVQLVQSNLNPKLEVSAIILTMYDARTKLAEQVAQEVRDHFGAEGVPQPRAPHGPALGGALVRAAHHRVRPVLARRHRLPRAGQGGERWRAAAVWVRGWGP